MGIKTYTFRMTDALQSGATDDEFLSKADVLAAVDAALDISRRSNSDRALGAVMVLEQLRAEIAGEVSNDKK